MRDLVRNRQTILYALQVFTEGKDRYGNPSMEQSYTTPLPFSINVSADKGDIATQPFGADIQYDRTMITHDLSCPIDEHSRLWVDGRAESKSHNYVVTAVSRSLNCVKYAIRKVEVAYGK